MAEDDIAMYRMRPHSPSSPGLPSSSNASSTNLPTRGTTSGMGERREISSSLLLARLREKREEALTVKKHRRDSGSIADDTSRIVSSPAGESNVGRSGEKRPTTSNGASERKGTMGARDMEETLSKMANLNFDLKFEIDQRRKKQDSLERIITELEKKYTASKDDIAAKEKTTLEIQLQNEQLLAELIQKDQALEEAVAIILEREAEIKYLKEENLAQPGDRGHTKSPPSSPPQLNYSRPEGELEPEYTNLRDKVLKGVPSFLSDRSRSTEALRAIWHQRQMNSSPELPKVGEEADTAENEDDNVDDNEDDAEIHNPRLSVLSRSSFKSVYDPEDSVIPKKKDEGIQPVSVQDWIDQRSPPKQSPASLLPRHERQKFLSLDHVAGSPIRRMDGVKNRLEQTLRSTKGIASSYSLKDEPDISRKSSGSSANIQTYTSGYLQNRFPPTPDTMSSNTSQFQRNSFDTLAKSSGSEDDRIGGTNRYRAVEQDPPHSYFDEAARTLQRSHRSPSNGRPSTAGEPVSSRQDGQGWDTDSQAGRTDDPWLDSARELGLQKTRIRVQPPRILDFSDRDDWSPVDRTESGVNDSRFSDDNVSGYGSDRTRQGSTLRDIKTPSLPRSITTGNVTGNKQVKKVNDRRIGSSSLRRRSQGPPVTFQPDKRPSTSRSSASSTLTSEPSTPSSETARRTSSTGSGRRIKPPATLRNNSRPPPSQSSTSNTPQSTPSTPSQGADDTTVARKGSLNNRCRLANLLIGSGRGRSETVSNSSPSAGEKSNGQSPSSQRSQIKKRNASLGDNVLTSSPSADLRKNPLMSLRSSLSGPSATPPTIKDNRVPSTSTRNGSGLPMSSASKGRDIRPSTSGSLDSKLGSSSTSRLAMPGFAASGKNKYGYSSSNNNTPGYGRGFGGDGAGDERDEGDFLFEKKNTELSLDHDEGYGSGSVKVDDGVGDGGSGDGGGKDESKMGRFKGKVLKSLGRRS